MKPIVEQKVLAQVVNNMHIISNTTSESLKTVRRTILFIESSVMPTEMSKPIRKRLNTYIDSLKQDEIRLAEYLEKTGGKMINTYTEKGVVNDTTDESVNA